MSHWNSRALRAAVACSVAAVTVVGLAPVAPAASGNGKVGKFETGALTPIAEKNPFCDTATGRFKFQYYAAPPCVKEWKPGTDNGGATAQGVTKDKIKVVVLWNSLPADQLGMQGVYTDQATGKNEPDGARAALLDENEVFKHVYETWGRTVEYEFVRSTGAGETEQRADALAVAEKKPFGVIDLASSIGTPGVGGGRIFQQAVLTNGVPFVTPQPRSIVFDTRTYGQLIAEFMKKQLVGGKAQYADASLASKERKFGILHSSQFDDTFFQSELKRLHLPAPVEAEYTIPATQSDVRADATLVQEALPTLITKLKDAGVTTLIMQTNHSVAGAASKVMAQQEWFPEIVVSSQPYEDLDLFARSFDQKVWSHAFGMAWFPPYLTGHADETAQAFQWFWGTDKGTRWPIAFYNLLGMYSAIQFVGPKLVAKAVTGEALAKLYSSGGIAAGGWYSKSAFTVEVRVAAPGEINPRGVAMAWWDPDATGPGNYNLGGTAKGKYVYLNDGKRFINGHLPTQKQKFFDKSVSVAQYDTAPPSEPKWPTYQCVGCPSTGSTEFVPAAAAG
jgi:hypothetical protein